MAAARNRRQRRVAAFRSSRLGRAVIRRLPGGVKRWLRAGRRHQRHLVAQLRSHWHRSLQLRVVATTLVLSAVVIAVLGFFLVQSIAAGLLAAAERSAAVQVTEGQNSALAQSSVDVLQPPSSQAGAADSAETVAQTTARALQQASDNPGSYLVFIQLTNTESAYVQWVGPRDVDIAATIPHALIRAVTGEQQVTGYNNESSAPLQYQPTTLVYDSGPGASGPALAVGVPLGPYYQLYYVFPSTQQQQTLVLVQQILVGVGLALVALLAAIASLVTRWVVLPVRHAAQAARRLSAGHLGERLPVLGKDDLAALATSFNEMAASLQDKLRELEELSQVQRQFVSDVSRELRTPLSTIKMAADLLFEARAELDAAAARSAELLASQLERFEVLLVDLLEISRFDAGAATLEAELTDVCDLVRRSADDAQQLAERRGSRIEFRLPAAGCFAELDRRRVERILRNILVNAVEHGEGRDVVVTTAMDSDAVAVSVRDYGCGLRPGEEQRVFERFWRADPARARTTGGSGLGLAISLEDARLHGGWLQAWGAPGNGSVFRLTLPRVAGQPLAGSPLPLGPDEAEMAGTPYPAAETSGAASRG
ncbi:MAG: HAMP domain-containing histidine kinase [Streptosporangiaceae bacterium]|nr:HAMP domain-containing histidine kinase [Streptosporangiaceae bacterium]